MICGTAPARRRECRRWGSAGRLGLHGAGRRRQAVAGMPVRWLVHTVPGDLQAGDRPERSGLLRSRNPRRQRTAGETKAATACPSRHRHAGPCGRAAGRRASCVGPTMRRRFILASQDGLGGRACSRMDHLLQACRRTARARKPDASLPQPRAAHATLAIAADSFGPGSFRFFIARWDERGMRAIRCSGSSWQRLARCRSGSVRLVCPALPEILRLPSRAGPTQGAAANALRLKVGSLLSAPASGKSRGTICPTPVFASAARHKRASGGGGTGGRRKGLHQLCGRGPRGRERNRRNLTFGLPWPERTSPRRASGGTRERPRAAAFRAARRRRSDIRPAATDRARATRSA